MPLRHARLRLVVFLAVLPLLAVPSCAPEYRPWWLGGTMGKYDRASGVFTPAIGDPFTEVLIQERTFVGGQVVVTATYAVGDIDRAPIQIDFNRDGRIDPVVGYQQGGKLGVVQILLSYDDNGTLAYQSLTLDGGENDWENLLDVAVGDIDNDGNPDLVIAATDGVFYVRHPSSAARTHILSEWGQDSGDLELVEGSDETISQDELDSIVATALEGTLVDAANYLPAVKQTYSNVEIGDVDNDGDMDIVASRTLDITLDPKNPDNTSLEPISLVNGSHQVLLNPGNAPDGQFWTGVAAGQHERHGILDRMGAGDMRLFDLDGDGDLDIISVAREDNNGQIVWFENPAGPGSIDPASVWTQHRIGSLLSAAAIDVADVTGDDRVDVLALSSVAQQLVLFVQPEEGPARGYDWYSVPIVTFESYEPRAVQVLDVDNDRVLEIVVAGTAGAIRYFEPPADPLSAWEGHVVRTLNPPGDVGQLGYGDLDGDGDADLVAAISDDSELAANRVLWIRNELLP